MVRGALAATIEVNVYVGFDVVAAGGCATPGPASTSGVESSDGEDATANVSGDDDSPEKVTELPT